VTCQPSGTFCPEVNPTTTDTTIPTNGIRASAEDALSRGFAILICKSKSKEPNPKHSPRAVNSSTRDPKILSAFDVDPQSNYGVGCGPSDITVLDVDRGIKSREQFEAWKSEHHIPETLTVQSGRTGEDIGYHMYFSGAVPTVGFNIGGVTGELKGQGGYVVGAGSIHPSGNPYTIIKDVPVVPLPEHLKACKHKKTVVKRESDALIPVSQRWGHLQSTAGKLRNAGLDQKGIYDGLKNFAAIRYEDGENYPDEKLQELAIWAASDKCDETETVTPSPYSVGFIKGGYAKGQPTDWRSLFRNSSEMSDAALKFLIEYFFQEESLAFIGGLSGHGKTLIALSIARAFIYGLPLFGIEKFKVTEQLPVIYLIPESGEKSFRFRMKAFHLLEEQIEAATGKKDMLLVRTCTQGEMINLNDERMLQACDGRVVILDTAIRFSDASDENSAAENRNLAESVFRMIARGARKIIGLHHAGKEFEKLTYMTLENVLRGSGDYGAMCSEVYGVRMVDEPSSEIYVECVKGRDLDPTGSFIIRGRPHINNTGDFKPVTQPDMTPSLAQVLANKKTVQADVLAQREMEKGRSSLVHRFRPFGAGIF